MSKLFIQVAKIIISILLCSNLIFVIRAAIRNRMCDVLLFE